jgi:hypothetical protein
MDKMAGWLKDCYWLSTEEKRRAMDYEEKVKEGDTVLVPSNLVPVGDITGGDLDGGDNFDDI